MSIHAKVSPSGRVSLPASIRKKMGLAKGGSVILQETDEGLLITTPAQALARIQQWARDLMREHPGMSVDDFIDEKRREAAREEEKFQESSTRRP